jgi:hypothetical protein
MLSLLLIFNALKGASRRLGFRPRTLSPMASTLTITSPKRLSKQFLNSVDEFKIQRVLLKTMTKMKCSGAAYGGTWLN